MVVLGIGGGLHDLSACLVEDGRLRVAIEQERLTRLKHSCDHGALTDGYLARDFRPYRRQMMRDKRIRDQEVEYCLGALGLRAEDVDAVVTSHFTRFGYLYRFDHLPARALMRTTNLNHHLAHAASAFLVSPCEEAAVVVVDSFGSHTSGRRSEATSIWRGRGTELTRLRTFDSSLAPGEAVGHSLGTFYSDMTIAAGFRVLDAGKTMGLAPYGGPRYLDRLREFVRLGPDGQVDLDVRYRQAVQRWAAEAADPDAFHADLAWAAQSVLEDCLLHIARAAMAQAGCRALCLAGGVALNSVANGRILEELEPSALFVQPASNDAGLAIGNAFWHYHAQQPTPARAYRMDTAYLGRPYGPEEIDAAVARLPGRLRSRRVPAPEEEAAERLARGEIVGWFQGRSEFGPRSLGNRSLLADPRRAEMKDTLNRRVKHREPFRPFAPAVLAEAQADWFELGEDSPFMLLVARVRAAQRPRIPAVTHVDGTARVQTVRREHNPLFHGLIAAFARRTGVPVVLNTSFNDRGDPIVETPGDALEMFLHSDIDALLLGDLLIEHAEEGRSGAPAVTAP